MAAGDTLKLRHNNRSYTYSARNDEYYDNDKHIRHLFFKTLQN